MGLAAFGDKVAVVGCVSSKTETCPSHPAGGAFDAVAGKALTLFAGSSFTWHGGELVEQSKRLPLSTREQNSRTYAAWSADGQGFAETFVPNNRYGDNAIGLLYYDESGKEVSGQRIAMTRSDGGGSVDSVLISISVASDGEQYLVVYQYGVPKTKPRREQLRGCYVSYDGKKLSEGDGFVIADDPAKSVVAGPVVAGPQGICLVVHPDTRDFDNTKIVARLVKSR
jgi:hypothetical protein